MPGDETQDEKLRFLKIRRLFEEAVDLPEGERRALLARECGDQPGLRAEVERLLARQADANDLTEVRDAIGSALAASAGPSMSPGDRIDNYTLVRRLGEGGMGEVWQARQTEPVRRQVALKLIKPGMDSARVITRFEAERQALAIMDHPYIARVFDAGTTGAGRPYFVMEYVEGEPITEYCDRHRLAVRERLALFCAVCEGVQHAHTKAVIHRDLKPSNVLVSTQDGRPAPKIIDFGVAKATEQRLFEQTVFTELGVLIGTPEYMSPEQAGSLGDDVDTRSDVYSLGVILYELLTGVLPFDAATLRKAGFDEIRRLIREVEPSRPSARLSEPGERTRQSAGRRGVERSSLRREIRGDLDWITMKALEKAPQRRYGSAHELAADLERYLSDEPVLAGPPSASYRMQKFVRRHRLATAFSSVLVVLLVAFVAFLAAERRHARAEADAAKEIAGFLTELFTASDPGAHRGEDLSAEDLLARGKQRIEELDGQPEVQTRLMETMGRSYAGLGLYDDAASLLEEALLRLRELRGEEHLETLDCARELTKVYSRLGRFDEAFELLNETHESLLRRYGAEHPSTLAAAYGLGSQYQRLGRLDDAEALFVRTLEAADRTLGENDPLTVNCLVGLGMVYFAQERYDEAEPLLVRSVAAQRKIRGEDHPLTLGCMNNLAILYGRQGKHEEARAILLEIIESQRRVLGNEHPDLAGSLNNFGAWHSRRGRHEEALTFYDEALAILRASLGEEHPRTLSTKLGLGQAYRALGKYAEAEPLLRDATGASSEKTAALAMATLGDVYIESGRLDQAGPLLDDALRRQRHALGDSHGDVATTLYYKSCLALARGDDGEAVAWLRRAVDSGRSVESLRTDPRLEPLHDNPEFRSIIERSGGPASAD